MADSFTLIIDSRGTPDLSRAERSVASIQGSVGAINRDLGRTGALLRRAFALAAIVGAFRAFQNLSDAVINVNNRIGTVTNSTRELNNTYRELFNISQRTRTSIGANADVFARVAVTVRQYGASSRDTLRFVESLNQAVQIGGSTSAEAENAIRQLSQGLASGALRGDEFRSVMEQLPIVADVIARRLRVTRGELRELAEQGALTGEIILEAFEDAREELDERFANLAPTIAQGFTQLGNALQDYVRDSRAATGASAALALGLGQVANNLDLVANATTIGGGALFAGFGANAAFSSIQQARFTRGRIRELRGTGRLSPFTVSQLDRLQASVGTGGLTGTQALGSAAEILDLDRQAGQITRFRREIEFLNDLHRRGAISANEHTNSIRLLGDAYDGSFREVQALEAGTARYASLLRLGLAAGLAAAIIGVGALTAQYIQSRRAVRALRVENEAFVETFDQQRRDVDAVIAGREPDAQILPGESPDSALARIAANRRRDRIDRLESRRGPAQERLDALIEERDALAANLERGVSPIGDSLGADRARYLELNDIIRTQEGVVRDLSRAVEAAEDPLNNYAEASDAVRISLGLSEMRLNALRAEIFGSVASQRAAMESNLGLRRSYEALIERGIDPFSEAVQEYLRTGAGPLDDESRRLIDAILQIDRTARQSDFGEQLAAQARRAREEIERFNQSLDDIRGNLQFRSFLAESQPGNQRIESIYSRLGIRSAGDLERFYERSDAGELLRLAGAEFDREEAERERRRNARRRPRISAFERFRANALEERRLFGFNPQERRTEALLGRIRSASRPGEFGPEQESEARTLIETNMRLAESYSALEQATDTFANNIGQGFHDLFTGTETSLRQVARNILSDLASQTISRFITRPLSNALFGGIGASLGLGGGQFGGTFTIPGSGPPDSALFAARVTPGETVTLTPPGERTGGNAGIGAGRPIVQNFNFPPQTNVQSLRRNRRALQREARQLAGAR